MPEKISIPRIVKGELSNYVVSLTPEAAASVKFLSSQTSISIKQLVSMIIQQAVEKNLIEFEDLR